MQPAFEISDFPAMDRTFRAKPGLQLVYGILLIFVAFLGLIPLWQVWHWFAGGPLPHGRMLLSLGVLVCFPLGLVCLVNSLRGFPRLTIRREGIELESALGKRCARWDSIDNFYLGSTYGGEFRRGKPSATAKITGPDANRGLLRSKVFYLPDQFEEPIADIVAEINTARTAANGNLTSLVNSAAVIEPEALGLENFWVPWLSLLILAILIGIFTLENLFPVSPPVGNAPSIQTLIAFGGLNREAIFSQGEWYRLFTAPLLHANPAHIIGNGIALILGGWFFERFVGRLWLYVFFVIGALGGSLGSILAGPAYQVSVGASGALMGLFAAMLVCSFRSAAGTVSRQRLLVQSLRILLPSLIPQFSSGSTIHVDYAAHFGGAISCALLAFLLLKAWPQGKRLPQQRTLARVIAVSGIVLFVGSGATAAINFPKYDIALIPASALPKSNLDRMDKAASLAKQYPKDPRGNMLLSQKSIASGDKAGKERELRVALQRARAGEAIFGPLPTLTAQGALAGFLSDEGRKDEARQLAQPVCSAPRNTLNLGMLIDALVADHLCE